MGALYIFEMWLDECFLKLRHHNREKKFQNVWGNGKFSDQLENLLSTYHIFNYFAFYSMFSYQQNMNITEVFHLKSPV